MYVRRSNVAGRYTRPGTDGAVSAPAAPGKRINYRRETSHHTNGGANADVDSDSRIAHNRSVRSHRATA